MKPIFYHIPKTGGTAIRRVLGLDKGKTLHVQSIAQHIYWSRKDHLDPGEKAYEFTFVRNPFDRAVSIWAFDRQHNNNKDSFDEFVEKLPLQKSELYLPQAHWMRGIEVDFVGRFERLATDVSAVSYALGMARYVVVPVYNASRHRPWREYYENEVTADGVREYYNEDFRRFGYSFETTK